MRVPQPVDDGRPAPAGQAEPSFGSLLRRLRLRARITQEALAERAGVSLATIEALEEARRRQPYPHTVAALAEALGLSADERAALQAAVPLRQQTAASTPSPDTTRPAARVRLPVSPTPLIGREVEITAATALLDPARSAVRLLTLTGPGGVGKTRLALAVAAALVNAYPDGVVFVDLAPLHDDRLVPATIAHALEVREAGGRSARELLLDHLQARYLLLVLDNFEHLLGAAPLLAELLEGCPQLTLLVTSRAALRLRAEQRFPVLPLAAPAEQPASDGLPGVEVTAAAPAVRLFVERAQAVAPDLVLDAGTAPTVAAICRRLDGMPLAIELAAARVALLRPAALLRRLEHRLPLLTGGPTDLCERQQTLRQTLAWSHDLLGPAEQALFRRLAVFSGSCTLDAATAVCGALAGGSVAGAEEEVLAGVSALLDQSLLRREGAEDAGGEPRVGMLETIREYGRERLEDSGEADAVRGAHAAYYLALAEAAAPHLRGPEQASWLTRLEADHANLRAALAWAQEQAAAETGLRLAVALTQFWALRGYFYEGRAWLSGLLRVPGGAPALRARALGAAGVLAYEQTDYDGAIALLGEAVALSGSLEAAGEAVHWRVLRDEAWSIRRGDAAGGVALLEASVALFGAAGDRPGLARAVMRLGFELWLRGEHRHARAALEEGVAAYRALGDAQGLVLALLYLSIVVREQGDYARATAVAEEAVARARALDARHALAWALVGLSDVALYQGAWERVDPPAEESLALFRALGVGMGAAFALHTLAQAAHGRGDLAQARTRLAESEVLAEAQGVGAGRAEIRHSQGLLARDTGDWAVAWALMAEGLAQCAAGGVLRHVPRSLEGLASVLVLQAGSGAAGARAMAVRAARLLAAATAQRAARGTPLPPAERPAYARAVAGVRALLGEAATAAAWAAGERLAPEQAVAEALGESPAG